MNCNSVVESNLIVEGVDFTESNGRFSVNGVKFDDYSPLYIGGRPVDYTERVKVWRDF